MGLEAKEDLLADYLGHSPKILVGEGIPGYAPQIEKFSGLILAKWQEACESLVTNKGRIAMMLEILPPELRIPQIVIPFKEKEKLRKTIEDLIKEGREVGLRTCFTEDKIPPPGTAPWIMGLKNLDLVASFFGEKPMPEPSGWTGFPETYQDWQKREGLAEIIVMGNPVGLGREELRKNHFVFRIETFLNDLRIELRIGTDQLRDIEAKTDRADLIEIAMKVGKSGYGIFIPGEITVAPGKNYLIDKAKINPLAEKIIGQVKEIVFAQWCRDPVNHLYYILLALDKFGLGAIEFQGRYDEEGNVEWILAHGFRGIREEKVRPRFPERLGGG